jgi:hypothetical protein
LAPLAPRVI